MQRAKKHPKGDHGDNNFWDCSVCTYQNKPEAFKCAICDVRKGTSTRKPKVSAQIVAQQIAQQYLPSPAKIHKASGTIRKHGRKNEVSHLFMENIDINSARQMEVTVGDLTVLITDYKLLPMDAEQPQQQQTIFPSPMTELNNKHRSVSPDTESILKCSGDGADIIPA